MPMQMNMMATPTAPYPRPAAGFGPGQYPQQQMRPMMPGNPMMAAPMRPVMMPMGPPGSIRPPAPTNQQLPVPTNEGQPSQDPLAPTPAPVSATAGTSTLLLPPTGTIVVGKRKRLTRVEQTNLEDEIGSLDSDEEIDKDDPKDMDAEALDDRLRVMQRQHGPLAAAAAAKHALKKTRHEYLLPFFRDQYASVCENLVPIRLDFELDGMKLKDAFMWNVKERFLTPKKFAEFMCEDLDVPVSMYSSLIEDSIKQQIAEHMSLLTSEVPFDADSRIVINLDILFNQYHLIDRFEWDLSSTLTPEEFAVQLAADLGLGSEFPPLVAHAIHEQLARVRHVVSAVSGGPGTVEDVDEANIILGMLRESTVRPIEVGLRQGREAEVEEWGPIVEEMSRDALERHLIEREKDRARKQRSNRAAGGGVRRGRGFFIDFNAGYMQPGNLADGEEGWATPEEKNAWKCSYCWCLGKSTILPRTGPLGPKTLCNACGLFFKAKDELPVHRKELFK
ncbi:SNF5-domain-containing protein [Rhizoclosmatium globosum]|uniref:SNF5-domain-containing protein n=1 Tax=Rhizoclosmatium globosum TaxID=329046 RepID=A0A1Y2CUZ1_9FUNG|nr:SNF5-domain-containing protein [Rhizoclosmatium globosum]|eukprot:ORY50861.1 SNF5-domain-containing protein [Rhizoclosmatium globosum]